MFKKIKPLLSALRFRLYSYVYTQEIQAIMQWKMMTNIQIKNLL